MRNSNQFQVANRSATAQASKQLTPHVRAGSRPDYRPIGSSGLTNQKLISLQVTSLF